MSTECMFVIVFLIMDVDSLLPTGSPKSELDVE
jgi:hypothetical protein